MVLSGVCATTQKHLLNEWTVLLGIDIMSDSLYSQQSTHEVTNYYLLNKQLVE